MKNRMGKFLGPARPRQAVRKAFGEEASMTIEEIVKLLKNATGYQLSASILGEKGRIEHVLITDNFPRVDMISSHESVKKLIIQDLEKTNLEEG